MIKKIYIGGKITGLTPEQYCKNFRDAKEIVCSYYPYAEIIAPTELCDDNWSWEYSMEICIDALWNCDAIVLLENWHDSRGAIIERKLAQKLGIPIMELENNKIKNYKDEF
jgi:hypothetical protein